MNLAISCGFDYLKIPVIPVFWTTIVVSRWSLWLQEVDFLVDFNMLLFRSIFVILSNLHFALRFTEWIFDVMVIRRTLPSLGNQDRPLVQLELEVELHCVPEACKQLCLFCFSYVLVTFLRIFYSVSDYFGHVDLKCYQTNSVVDSTLCLYLYLVCNLL